MCNNLIIINRKLHIYKEFYVSINGYRERAPSHIFRCVHTQAIVSRTRIQSKRNETLSCGKHRYNIVGLIAAIHWHTIIYLHVNSMEKKKKMKFSFDLFLARLMKANIFGFYSNLPLTNGRTTKRPCWSIFLNYCL